MAVTALHMFGWRKENELKSTLETHLGEQLEKTTWRYDSIDFTSPSWVVELKSRLRLDKHGEPQMPTSFKTWLLPVTKVEAAKGTPLRARYYYYWDFDQSLWYLDHDAADWDTFVMGVPTWHNEEHYWVPRELWKPVEGSRSA